MAYVLKLTDPEYPSSFVYIGAGCILSQGSHGWFLEDSVFETEDEAEKHIQACLESGWYRPDITPTNFEVVEVRQYKGLDFGFFYYTEAGYKQFKGE